MVKLVEVSKFCGAKEFLYELLKERPKEANISHKDMPSYAEHEAFVNSAPYFAWYIVELNGKPVGSVYLTLNNELGVFIKKEYQRRGFGKHALRELMRKHFRYKYLANVAPGNEASIKMFESMRAKHIQNTYLLEGRV